MPELKQKVSGRSGQDAVRKFARYQNASKRIVFCSRGKVPPGKAVLLPSDEAAQRDWWKECPK